MEDNFFYKKQRRFGNTVEHLWWGFFAKFFYLIA